MQRSAVTISGQNSAILCLLSRLENVLRTKRKICIVVDKWPSISSMLNIPKRLLSTGTETPATLIAFWPHHFTLLKKKNPKFSKSVRVFSIYI